MTPQDILELLNNQFPPAQEGATATPDPTGVADPRLFPPAPNAYMDILDPKGAIDPMMTGTFGSHFTNFGQHFDLGADALGLFGLLDQSPTQTALPPYFPPTPAFGLPAIANEVDPSCGVDPCLLFSDNPAKRKEPGDTVPPAPVKRPRGRPPKARPTIKAASVPQNGRGSLPAFASPAVLSSTPRSINGSGSEEMRDCENSESPTSKLGKMSTARPKSVVPEKFLKDGSAQAVLGLTSEEIQSFPTFEDMLNHVPKAKLAGATRFQQTIEGGRDKAKEAAKKSRDDRRAKIDGLEGDVAVLRETVADLESKQDKLLRIARDMVARGFLSEADLQTRLA